MITQSPVQTRHLGEHLASLLCAGDVLLLKGDLGAGKSEFTRGLARGLGITGPVPSPSFTILNVYEDASIPLYHFDWYRLHSSEELYEMGMDEWIGGDGIAVIEWPTQCPDAIPETCLEIVFTTVDETTRNIEMIPRGAFRDLPCFGGEYDNIGD
ncbi:MAG: tRNA (adenosine(37)-N6)-threonylcarbamoyltransferase complex ATPase subunit type 1 TsaE [Clostridia bacterium]|nr:tRNA (adenosine(37)-N6)-threonylcarbamoyltransferase complex ATPase subunit type 1 TsaE [Clostridia bacterium]